MSVRYRQGTVEGTAAAIEIDCGFIPDAVDIINIDGDCKLNWTSDMGAGKGYKILTTSGAHELIATGGITADTVDDFLGFTIGTDSDINASSETLIWKAWLMG